MAAFEFTGSVWLDPIVTWSFGVPGPDTNFTAPIETAAARARIAAAFDRWEAVVGLDFVWVPDAPGGFNLPDIRIGFANIPGAAIGITRWRDFFGFFAPGVQIALEPGIDLYPIALHEIGHAIGLDHVDDPTQIMARFAGPLNRDLGAGDIEGARLLYGPPFERRAPTAGDVDADGFADLLWQRSDPRQASVTLMKNGVPGPMVTHGNALSADWRIRDLADLDGNGSADILWRADAGQVVVWMMGGGGQLLGGGQLAVNPGPSWRLVDAADMDRDRRADLLWQGQDGQVVVWKLNGQAIAGGGALGLNPGPAWRAEALADTDGDGRADILWRNQQTGQAAVWLMDGTTIRGGGVLPHAPGQEWQLRAAADLGGDGRADLVWQSVTGQVVVWSMDGTTVLGGGVVGPNPGPSWRVVAARDLNGDGRADLLWQSAQGQVVSWLMDGLAVRGGGVLATEAAPNWVLV